MGILGAGYSDATFKKNFETKRDGFRVNFDGTAINKHFNWRDVVEDSYSIKFFGSPLLMTRNFDAFKAVRTHPHYTIDSVPCSKSSRVTSTRVK